MVASSSSEKTPMGRPRKHATHLPPCVYLRHGAYWYVKRGKWERLGSDLPTALSAYGRLFCQQPSGGMATLLKAALEVLLAKPLAQNTKAQYSTAVRMLAEAFAEFTPEQIRAKDIYRLKRGMITTPNMFNRCLSVLRQVFDYALSEEILDDNPAAAVKGYQEAKRKRLLSTAEFQAIYDKAPPRLRCLMDLWRLTGQRVMDVASIRQSDLLPEGVAFRQKKTDARLIVKWNPELQEAVERAKSLNGNIRSLTLFATVMGKRRGSAPAYSTIRAEWDRACELAGVEDAQMRDLRAVSVTAAKQQGKDPRALAGHTSESMTRRYIRDKETPIVEGPSFGQASNIGQKK